MDNVDELCKGCLLYERHTTDPDSYSECLGYEKKDIRCPCRVCLIKMICLENCDLMKDRPWIQVELRNFTLKENLNDYR